MSTHRQASSPTVETRPDRALYNVEVTLRMVDRLLSDLSDGAHRTSAPPLRSELADRVRGALQLLDRLSPDVRPVASTTPDPVVENLRNELVSLLAVLQEPASPI
jgi:hypothetical protein